jgi:uncharacterized protein (TIGR02145 family)
LVLCPTIQSIISSINDIAASLPAAGIASNPPVKYGDIFSFYVLNDARFIAPAGWHVVQFTADYSPLRTFLGGQTVAGGKLKTTGTTYWNSPNTGATNSSKLNLNAGGYRSYTGAFSEFRQYGYFWIMSEVPAIYPNANKTGYTDTNMNSVSGSKKNGYPIRLVKDSTVLAEGQTGTMTGNDGKVYRTICVNGREWMADNSRETKFRNGDLIPIVTDPATWAASADISSMKCYCNGDPNNS